MCLHPYTKSIINKATGKRETIQFPCGHCIECLRDYQNNWKIRLSEEFADNPVGVFFTLTYEPSTAPLAFDMETGELVESDEYLEYIESNDKRVLSLRHDDTVNWLKRCRENYFRSTGKRLEFKYFICGEYGPRTLRPHYHGFMIGISYYDFMEFFYNDWTKKYGFVDVSQIVYSANHSPQRVANYVSKYCTKGNLFENPRVAAGYVEKPRRTMSKGIGKNYAQKLRNRILPNFRENVLRLDRNNILTKKQVLNWLKQNKNDVHDNYAVVDFYTRESVPQYTESTEGKKIMYKESVYHHCISNGYRIDFLDELIDNLKINYYDYETKRSYSYKMPRYVRDLVIGSQSALKNAVQARIQARVDADRIEQLEKLQAAYPDWSYDKAYHEVVLHEMYEKRERAASTTKSLKDFYSKSRF